MAEKSASASFHLAIPVHDLDAAREFYGQILGCPEGRSAPDWVDFNFAGHQLVCHRTLAAKATHATNFVDGDSVPIPHFGLVLDLQEWERLARKLSDQEIEFVIKPHIRFAGTIGEQGTFFLTDPSGNNLEFKGFKDMSYLFRPFAP